MLAIDNDLLRLFYRQTLEEEKFKVFAVQIEKEITVLILLFSVAKEEFLKQAQNLGVKDFILSSETSPRQLCLKIREILKLEK